MQFSEMNAPVFRLETACSIALIMLIRTLVCRVQVTSAFSDICTAQRKSYHDQIPEIVKNAHPS